MRNKTLHTIFPDTATANSDSTIRTAFADLLPAQSQTGETASNSPLNGGPSLDVSSLASNPAQGSGEAALPELLTDVSKNLDRLRAVTETQTTETTANTAALGVNTSAKSLGETVANAGKSAASGFLGGLTSIPLISGLVKLFGGGSDTPTPPALPKYEAPASLAFDRTLTDGNSGSEIGEPTYDQFGNPKLGFPDTNSAQSAAELFSRLIPGDTDASNPASSLASGIYLPDANLPDYSALLANIRAYTGQPAGDDAASSASQDPAAAPTTSAGTANTTQVTVNVQAMDSRSFLDRSQDIAQAVREAMLNMHSINDVVNDL